MTEKKRAPAKKLSFSEAVAEVEEILGRLEEDAIDIDDLAAEVRRAVELIQICREKLGRTDREVRELVAGLQAGTDPAAAESAGDDRAAGAARGEPAGEDLSF